MIDATMSECLSEGELVRHRLRTLHRSRAEAIRADQSHVRLSDASRLIVHVIPESAVREPKSVPAAELKRAAEAVRTPGDALGFRSGSDRYNADGYLMSSGRGEIGVRSYVQLYRDGVYEGVMAEAVARVRSEQVLVLRETWCEDAMVAALTGYLQYAPAVGLECPIWVFAALVGCEGAKIHSNRGWGFVSDHGIDRNTVWLPEEKVSTFDVEPVTVLSPMVDVLWNAAGLEKSVAFPERHR